MDWQYTPKNKTIFSITVALQVTFHLKLSKAELMESHLKAIFFQLESYYTFC
jgi:hypothetical protein